MYLHINVVIQGIISLIDFNAFLSTDDSPYCTFCGFMQSYVIFIQLIAIWWIVLDLFLMSMYHFYVHNQQKLIIYSYQSRLKLTNKNTIWLYQMNFKLCLHLLLILLLILKQRIKSLRLTTKITYHYILLQ